jgi:multidrug efflux pump subunit AcrA (membrane-fusion protein)
MPSFSRFAVLFGAVTVAAAWMFHARAADKPEAYSGPAVTVVKARKGCFSDEVAINGILTAREEIVVLPEREGLQITAVSVEAGDIVRTGQALARLTPIDTSQGSSPVIVQSPVGGIVLKSSAILGTMASARAEPMFSIIAYGEFELLAQLSAKHLAKLSVGQTAKIDVIGGGEVTGRVRIISGAVDGVSQMGSVRVFIGVNPRLRVGAFAHALVKTGESCGPAIPLSALLYDQDSTVIAMVRSDRVEMRPVSVGVMSQGEVEIRDGLAEGDLVVARAGAFLRDGDRVRPVLAEGKK